MKVNAEKVEEAFRQVDELRILYAKDELFPAKLNVVFRDLANHDYRHETLIKIEYYVKTFVDGAWVQKELSSIHRTARNSERFERVQDVEFFVRQFINEDYKTVQEPFWKKYKIMFHGNSVQPKVILHKIKKVKAELKNNPVAGGVKV